MQSMQCVCLDHVPVRCVEAVCSWPPQLQNKGHAIHCGGPNVNPPVTSPLVALEGGDGTANPLPIPFLLQDWNPKNATIF